MKSAQESKNELEASIRYAENAISSAKQTIESLATHQEQTGREEALTKQVQELERELQRQQDLGQKYYNNVETLAEEVNRLRSEKEASSGPCGCQAYRDLEEARGRAEGEVELLQSANADLEERADSLVATIQRLKRDEPTMPVIPKDVAIAIFREGVQHGVEAACTELEGQTINIEESDYCGDFEVSFSRRINLDDELDLDWMRGKCGDYSEESAIEALKNLCADKEFECRIHGVDDQEEKKNED